MPCKVIFHAPGTLSVLGAQIADRQEKTPTGSPQSFTTPSPGGIARIVTGEACEITIGAADSAPDGTKGEPWAAGDDDVRYVAPGQVIKVRTLA